MTGASAHVRRDVSGRRGVRAIGRSRAGLRAALVVLSLAAGLPLASAQTPDETLRSTLAGLNEASYPDKETIVATLSDAGHPGTRDVLTAFLEDRLYARNADKMVFIVRETTYENQKGEKVAVIEQSQVRRESGAARE